MAYKLIAIDLDDTFIDNEGRFSQRTKEAVYNASVKGIYIVIASGRAYIGIKSFYAQLKLNTPSIVYGGAMVVDPSGKILYESPLPHHIVKNILEYAKTKQVHAQIYIGTDYFFEENNVYSEAYAKGYGIPGIEKPGLLKQNNLSTPKVLFISEPERILEIKNEAAKLFPELGIAISKPRFLEFNNPDANKGNALKFLTEYLSFKREEVIAIGDSEIDLSMIEYAGLGIAVENALPHVRKTADIITFSNEEDGVAHILEKVLEERI